ncbi:hypothetical protein tb265_16670 [Gemmatimonadetes bacterium T265]|nr:hypothetical protein tb265_16670 [Gemmatimonadetes bacterium T265]
MSQFTPVVPQPAIVLHSVPAHERTVVRGSPHPLAVPEAFTGDRDPLTGCLTGSHLAQLGARLARAGGAPVGAIVILLEGEGSAGDDRGVPDAVLRDALRVQTARFLMRHVRGTEPLLRTGDDAFLVLVPGAGPRDTERVARRVQLLAFNKAPGALSLGWASRQGEESLDALVARAREARVPVPQGGRGEERRRS